MVVMWHQRFKYSMNPRHLAGTSLIRKTPAISKRGFAGGHPWRLFRYPAKTGGGGIPFQFFKFGSCFPMAYVLPKRRCRRSYCFSKNFY